MKVSIRVWCGIAAVLAVHQTAASAYAQCPTYVMAYSVRAYGTGGVSIRSSGTSFGPNAQCPNSGHVQVETWIPTAPNSDWKEEIWPSNHGATAESEYQGNVWGLHTARARHHQLWYIAPTIFWQLERESFENRDLGQPPPPQPDPGCDWNLPYYHPDSGNCESYPPSPIVISIGNNSVRLTSAQQGVAFDIDADGELEQVAWTQAGASDAFLVFDRNGNGVVDDGTELFGNHAPLAMGGKAFNGFDALRDVDGGLLSNGQVDASDAVYAQLRLWFDRNHNGVSEPGELETLAAHSVAELYTGYEQHNRRDGNGNRFLYRGMVAFTKAQGQLHRRFVYDVFLNEIR